LGRRRREASKASTKEGGRWRARAKRAPTPTWRPWGGGGGYDSFLRRGGFGGSPPDSPRFCLLLPRRAAATRQRPSSRRLLVLASFIGVGRWRAAAASSFCARFARAGGARRMLTFLLLRALRRRVHAVLHEVPQRRLVHLLVPREPVVQAPSCAGEEGENCLGHLSRAAQLGSSGGGGRELSRARSRTGRRRRGGPVHAGRQQHGGCDEELCAVEVGRFERDLALNLGGAGGGLRGRAEKC
jgi:hypothetical protein